MRPGWIIHSNRINTVADRVPHLCKVSPAGPWHIEDVHRAGGVPAILNEVQRATGALHLDRMTVAGRTLAELDQRRLYLR